MTAVESRTATETFESRNPRTGGVVGTYPVHSAADVADAVSRAHRAADWWAGLGFGGRKPFLLRWKSILARRSDELCILVNEENGKPLADAFTEVLLTVEHLGWATRNAKRVLGPSWVPSTALTANQLATVEYQPLGVVGIIGPWNYPVFTPMGSIAYALAAGNAVVFKPSEHTPAVGHWLADTFAEAVPGAPVFQVVTGFGETGAALCSADVDKLAFTGSARTGRKVMAACAENLTPVLMECGGKDPMIVAEDADIDAAVNAAIYGGLQNAGQACVSVERVYVVDAVYDTFVEQVIGRARQIHAGDEGSHLGPITMPGQIDVISEHVDDALRRGGRAVVGGPESIRPPYVDPVVLVDLPDDARAIQEETFGPTLPIIRVRDTDEAVRLANSSSYGLGATVFSRNQGMDLARRLRTGMTAVNDYASFASIPALPFGGRGESGFGRIHGADGLREFTHPKATARKILPLPSFAEMATFHRDEQFVDKLTKVWRARHGRHWRG